MKLFDTLLFVLTLVFFVIGIFESIRTGVLASYWLFMLSVGCLIWYNVRKKGRPEEDTLEVRGRKKDKKRRDGK